jgi:hypothetical protein
MRGLGVSGKVETISWGGRDKLSCPALGFNWTTGVFTSVDHLSSRTTGNMKCEMSMSMLRVNIERRVQPIDRSCISLNSCCDPKSDMNEADPHTSLKGSGVVGTRCATHGLSSPFVYYC